MNTQSVNNTADAISRAMQKGRTLPASLAVALDKEGLLQTTETVAELASYRALDLGGLDDRVSASCEHPNHPTWLRAKIDPRGCPWCEIDKAHEDATGANLARWEEEQDNARLRLALESARRGRRELRARVAELEGEQTIYRVVDGINTIALYTTAEQAKKHCEASARAEHRGGSEQQLFWRLDEDTADQPDGPMHLIESTAPGYSRMTGFAIAPAPLSKVFEPGSVR